MPLDGMEIRSSEKADEKTLVFFSYTRQDKTLRDKLEEHLSNLKYRGLITTWHEREITAGEELKLQIDVHLNKAQVILLLISASFMASDYCYGVEMERALARHRQGEARVIPILLRPVHYTGAPFAWLNMLPTNGKPIVTWRNRDSAFVDIALGIEQVVEERQKAATVSPALPGGGYSQPGWSANAQPGAASAPTPLGQSSQPAPPSLRPAYRESPYAAPPHPYPPVGRAARSSSRAASSWSRPPARGYPPVGQAARRNSRRFALIGLVILIVLLVIGVLLVQHPNFLLPVVLSLLVLAAIFIAIRVNNAIAGSRREQETSDHEREEARRREQAESQRREQEEARKRAEEALIREREEARRQEQEQDYYNKALMAYEQALQIDSRDVAALKGKANALDGLGRYGEALEALQQAIALESNAATYSRIGDVLTKLKQYENALAAYQQALALDPTLGDAYYHMGDALDKLGKRQEAAQAREKGRQLGYEEQL